MEFKVAILKRRANAPVYKRYSSYKKLLREDFSYTCVYCSLKEEECGGLRAFSVEHFKPKGNPRFKSLECDYSNLLYACGVCNSFKSDDWPSDSPLVSGQGYIDPCQVDYEDHFTQNVRYEYEGKTSVGSYMVKRLHLDRPQIRRLLRLRAEKQANVAEMQRLVVQLRLSINAIADPSQLHHFTLLVNELDQAIADNAVLVIPRLSSKDYA